jgi:SAM-dependent methyltransferase
VSWLRFARPFSKIPPIRFFVGDASEIELGEFDSIFASNVLHHTKDPAALLAKLSKKLKTDGVFRLVTYPKASRFWMRKTSVWLKSRGLSAETPLLVKEARNAIRTLPPSSPIRSCFESQPETRRICGLIDAFFNACENPLSPLEWARACREACLELVSEGQTETSRSDFLNSFLLNSGALTAWEKLQILDDTWELCANPVLFLRKLPESSETMPDPGSEDLSQREEYFFSHPMKEADVLLRKAGRSLEEYRVWLRQEVGPRTHPKRPDELLRGLSITEYDLDYLLSDDLGFSGGLGFDEAL